MECPSLFFLDLHDSRYRFDSYWDKVRSIDVRKPKTRIIELEETTGKYPECPTDIVIDFMREHGLNQAFIRSGYKASVDRLKEGSIIHQQNREDIEKTYKSLMRQHLRNNIKHGNILVVREKIDLDYCLEPSHSHAPEIRYFIEDGSIIGKTPLESNYIPNCPRVYSFIEKRMQKVEEPTSIAKKVALEFKESKYPWSVDIVLDSHGRWWVTEMHINGVYYNKEREEWMNICGQGDNEVWSPCWMHQSALFEVPTEVGFSVDSRSNP